jgi:hypothetical protein
MPDRRLPDGSRREFEIMQPSDSTNPPAEPAPAPAPGYPPGAGYPPAPAYGSPIPRPGTPGILIAAGVVLLVLAVLLLLWCVLFVIEGAMLGSIGNSIQNNPDAFNFNSFNSVDVRDLMDTMRPVFIGFAGVALLVALAHGAAGIGVIGRRGWARITGFVLGGLGLALNLLGLILTLIGARSARPITSNGVTIDPLPTLLGGVIVFGVFALAYGFVVLALARRGADFG